MVFRLIQIKTHFKRTTRKQNENTKADKGAVFVTFASYRVKGI